MYLLEEILHLLISWRLHLHDPLVTIIKKRQMQFYGHTHRAGNLATTILQESVDGKREEEGPVPHG